MRKCSLLNRTPQAITIFHWNSVWPSWKCANQDVTLANLFHQIKLNRLIPHEIWHGGVYQQIYFVKESYLPLQTLKTRGETSNHTGGHRTMGVRTHLWFHTTILSTRTQASCLLQTRSWVNHYSTERRSSYLEILWREYTGNLPPTFPLKLWSWATPKTQVVNFSEVFKAIDISFSQMSGRNSGLIWYPAGVEIAKCSKRGSKAAPRDISRLPVDASKL